MNRRLRALCAVGLAVVAVCVVHGQSAPTVTAVSPSAAYNYAATAITITGAGFQSGATVKLGTTSLSSVAFLSSTTLTATVPAKLLSGPYDVTVTNPGGQSAARASAFTVRASRGGALGPWLGTTVPPDVNALKLMLVREPYAYFWVSSATIARGTIEANGSLSNWSFLPGPGPGGSESGPVVTTDGAFIWLVRARDASASFIVQPAPTIDWAPLASDGSIGAWRQQTLPFFRSDPAFIAANGHLFVIGGSNPGFTFTPGGPPMRAPVGVDGTPGTWETLPQLPGQKGTPDGEAGAAIIGRHLFVAAHVGARHVGSSEVFRTTIGPDGSLGPWQNVKDVLGTRMVAANGFFYTQFARAELLSDDTTGPWIPTTSNGLRAASDSYLYAIEGNSFLRAEGSPLTLAAGGFARPAGGVTTLSGTDFLDGTTVTVDGVPATDVVVNSLEQLTARVPPHAAGAASVTITTPQGRTATSSTALVYDGAPPTGSFRINNDALLTPVRSVTLTLVASDAMSSVTSMAFSNDGTTFTDFEPFAVSKTWSLPDSDGTRTVYARFKDVAGNVSATVSDDILLDQRAPSGTIYVNENAISTISPDVSLQILGTAATSATTVDAVSFSPDGMTWDAWLSYPRTQAYTFTFLPVNGLKTVYARFRDTAGHVSPTVADTIYLDLTPALNSVSINQAATYTSSTTVTLTLGAPGAGYSEMLISNDGGFTGAVWERYSSRRTWTLPENAGSGAGSVVTKVVYVRYRSSLTAKAGSTTVQDDIILDTTPPSGTVTISSSGSQLALAATDDLSGVTDMAVSMTASFVGTSWELFKTSRAWSGGMPFVKFRDRAGNISPVITPAGLQDRQSPFGSFDIPQDFAVAHGSLALGGWALDDAGVTAVRIFRDPVAGEPNEIFIGNAVFVDGARPDVASLFSTVPSPTRAGWGLLVLTPVLPFGANGTFTFSAYADDADGNTTLLGRRTVSVDNVTSMQPFGTIDTPGQGEAVSGREYVNFGWVLTPRPKRIPTDGSTINVYVDGQLVGHPIYNVRRDDVAGLFPTLANATGAIGYLILDTTRYADGLHTIGWTVVDDAGAAEGVGSRYFRIQNGPALRTASAPAATAVAPLAPDESCQPGSRTGHEPAAEWQPLKDKDAPEIVTNEDRIELRFCVPIQSAYLVLDGERRPLPVGASIDASAGTFAWEPGPAFLGQFEFVFGFEATPEARIRMSLLPEK